MKLTVEGDGFIMVEPTAILVVDGDSQFVVKLPLGADKLLKIADALKDGETIVLVGNHPRLVVTFDLRPGVYISFCTRVSGGQATAIFDWKHLADIINLLESQANVLV